MTFCGRRDADSRIPPAGIDEIECTLAAKEGSNRAAAVRYERVTVKVPVMTEGWMSQRKK